MAHSRKDWLLLGVTIVILVQAGAGGGGRAQEAPTTATPATHEDSLAARLGGTRLSFEARYGPPIAGSPAIGEQYGIPGYGLVMVQYQPRQVARPEDRALVITLRSRRAAEKPATTPDDADWTIARARELARHFLPADAVWDTETPTGNHGVATSCRSDALAEVFAGSRSAGRCQSGFVMPTAGTVSFITLTVSAAAPSTAVATPVDPCTGMVGWAQQTGQRMLAATELLTTAGAIAETDPTAPAQFRQHARQFSAMADEQQTGPVPAAAVAANELLVKVFTHYAAALDLVATGIEAEDAQVVDRATAMIEGANADVTRVDELMRTAFAECGLDVGTPAAG